MSLAVTLVAAVLEMSESPVCSIVYVRVVIACMIKFSLTVQSEKVWVGWSDLPMRCATTGRDKG